MEAHTLHICTTVSLFFFCSVSHRFFAVALLSSFVFYRRRRHTNEACDIHFFLPNLTALIKCVLNKHFIRSFMYAWMRECVCARWFYQNSQLHEQWATGPQAYKPNIHQSNCNAAQHIDQVMPTARILAIKLRIPCVNLVAHEFLFLYSE